jgi:hypothetical protein
MQSAASITTMADTLKSPLTWFTNSTRTGNNFVSFAIRIMPPRKSVFFARPPRICARNGISFAELAEAARQPEADPFDLLCHLAFNAPLRTRRERAQKLRETRKDFFDKYGPEARQILEELLEKYAEHGDAQFVLPDVLKVPPLSSHGEVGEIIRLFGGAERLRFAVNELQRCLYAA